MKSTFEPFDAFFDRSNWDREKWEFLSPCGFGHSSSAGSKDGRMTRKLAKPLMNTGSSAIV